MTTVASRFPNTRLRRLRQHPKLRDMIRENHLRVTDLIQPLFIRHGEGIKKPLSSMPGLYQLSVDQMASFIDEIVQLGIPSVMLFGIPEHKDSHGSAAMHDHGVVQQAIREVKKRAPDLMVNADLCFCEYTDHGHCGVMNDKSGRVDLDNDATLKLLAEQAVSLARAGVDSLAPSGNIDGMVKVIREALDKAGFEHVSIISHTVKYASSLYGPFREAAEGAPQFGDRKTYQIDPANGNEALREAKCDVAEGADILMVKPAHAYLDVIFRIKQAFPEIPLAAYHVSGEYAMLKAVSANGWLDERRAVLEILTGIKRAGADIIVTYYATEVAKWLSNE